MNFKILGTGSYVPERVLTNDELEKMVETSDEWIKKRVGISERHICTDETTSDLGIKAAEKALLNSGVKAEELDLIICATISGEDVCPTVAAKVQSAIGATCPAFDVSSACSGFLFALETAYAFFAGGKVKKALVLASERLSKLVDFSDRNTCVIFGDGAGAVVLGEGENYMDSKIRTIGGDDVIKIPSFAGTSPFYTGEKNEPYIYMNGQETFKFAVESMCNDVLEIMEKNNLSSEDIAYIVPHQANARIIQFGLKRLKMSEDKIFMNLSKYGNTGGASIAISLDEMNIKNMLKKGDKIILTAFGGGLSSGVCLIEW
ncbi:MAG: ketoacyl-ACP synthase III [Clostridia bacterium]|nr:ketoacyl-ACP synthase III [Clostridia bacterium]